MKEKKMKTLTNIIDDPFAVMEGEVESFTDLTTQGIPINNKTLLIDADTIAYIACVQTETEDPILPEWAYSSEEYKILTSDPNYDPVKGVIYKGNVEEALESCKIKIERMKELTGCRKVSLHFSLSRTNFRYKLYPDYKAHRKSYHTPVHLEEVKKRLKKLYPSHYHKNIEADDVVSYLKRKYPNKYILAALDKDVIYQTPGRHLNYMERDGISMEWVEVSDMQAFWFRILQTIAGDSTDGVKGLPNVGIGKIKKDLIKTFDLELEAEDLASLASELTTKEINKFEAIRWMINLFKSKGYDFNYLKQQYYLVSLGSIEKLRPFKFIKALEKLLSNF